MTRASTGAFRALVATLAIQIYVSLAATAMSVLAPVVAPDFSLSPDLVGVFVSLTYAGAMSASLFSGTLIVRFGAIRVSQLAVLLCALGVVLLPLASTSHGAVLLLVLSPLVIGAGYGPITPASSQVLARTAPPSQMALIFSIKQTGVPAGAALGGVLLPTVTLAFGWRTTLVVIAAMALIVVLAAQRIRSDLDRDRQRARQINWRELFRPLPKLFASAILTELTIVAFFYAALQMSLTSFLVVYLTQALGWSLIAAGFALTIATIGGVGGRIFWGFVADRYVMPRKLLGWLGILAGSVSIATALYPPDFAPALLLALIAVFGATAIGWNGVQLAEVARHAPPDEAATITGASGFVTFAGVVVGPTLFGLIASATGDYRYGFAVVGIAIVVCGMLTLARLARAKPHS
ncbi:MAG TPA: MFS transporter [Casimicrobiaceae bacterium]|nr:MFS transporter [Casimicrobiaceae bacterium]